MSAEATAAPAPRIGPRPRTKLAAIAVLACLAALAAYAMFSGPTTVPLPTHPQAGPGRTAPPAGGDDDRREGDR